MDKPYTVRTKETGDKVYLIKEGKYHWITSPKALRGAGFSLGDEKNIKYDEFVKFKEGEKIGEGPQTSHSVPAPVEVEVKNEEGTVGKPVLGYKESATLDDFSKYND